MGRCKAGVWFSGAKGLMLLLLAASIQPPISHGQSRTTPPRIIRPLQTSLQPGRSSFVIAVPRATERTITFFNQNSSAEGRFSIAVSNQQLPVNSPFWSVVRGAIRFRHQRQFAVSLDGIEANYVRLTFEVRPLRQSAQLK